MYCVVASKSSLFQGSKMGDREHNVFMAKLAEQAERFEGKKTVFDAISRLSEVPPRAITPIVGFESVAVGKQFF